MKIRKLNETGEWPLGVDWKYIKDHPEDNDQDVQWLKKLSDDCEFIKNKISENIKFDTLNIRGFDTYQGPYANINIEGGNYKIWTLESNLFIEDFPVDTPNLQGFKGNKNEVVDVINDFYKKNNNEELFIKKFNEETIEDDKFYYVRDALGDTELLEAMHSENMDDILNNIIKKYNLEY